MATARVGDDAVADDSVERGCGELNVIDNEVTIKEFAKSQYDIAIGIQRDYAVRVIEARGREKNEAMEMYHYWKGRAEAFKEIVNSSYTS